MSMNVLRLMTGLLLALGLLASTFDRQRLRTELAAAQRLAQAAQQGNVERDAVIVALREQAKRERQAMAVLHHERTRIRAFHNHRETMIRSLEHDHPSMRSWAKMALPDGLIRLRCHAPFTGAAAYHQRLPAREPLPVTGDRTADERSAESRIGGR